MTAIRGAVASFPLVRVNVLNNVTLATPILDILVGWIGCRSACILSFMRRGYARVAGSAVTIDRALPVAVVIALAQVSFADTHVVRARRPCCHCNGNEKRTGGHPLAELV